VLVASLAKRLGRDVASDELFLLALLELPEGLQHGPRSRRRESLATERWPLQQNGSGPRRLILSLT
jgi:hypothetical protein